MNNLLLICGFQALFLALLVFLKRNRVLSDKILAAWLFIISIHLFLEYLQFYNSNKDFRFPWLIGLDVSFTVLHASLIYLYILSYSRIAHRWWNYGIHLVPFTLINLLLYIFYYSENPGVKISDFESVMRGEGFIIEPLRYLTYLIMIVVVLYLVAAIRLINIHKRNIRDHFSDLKGLDLQWMRVLVYSLGAIVLVAIILEIMSNTLLWVPAKLGSVIVFILIAFGIFYIGIQGILTTDKFSTYNPNLTMPGSAGRKLGRTASHGQGATSDQESNMVKNYQRLTQFMTTEKPFLEASITLQSLASMVDMKPHDLSKLINRKSGSNFFDFVNSYRIEEFKQQVVDPVNKNYTLLSVAFSCGFNSKTAFNRVFKNATGQSPSEYYSMAMGQELS